MDLRILLALTASLLATSPQVASAKVTHADQRLTTTLGRAAPLLLGAARIGAQYGIVTSGFRTVEHNRRVGGMPNSYHLLGLAIDIQRRPGTTHAMVDAALRRGGYILVESLDEGDHSHFAIASGVPLRPTPAPVLASAAAPAAKEAPAPSPLLADSHGVLLIDGTPATSAASAGN